MTAAAAAVVTKFEAGNAAATAMAAAATSNGFGTTNWPSATATDWDLAAAASAIGRSGLGKFFQKYMYLFRFKNDFKFVLSK